MSTRKKLGGGLLIPERCQFSALAANDGSSTGSSYTEANPRPGLPVASSASSQLRLEMSGQQGVDVDVRAVRSGSPARDGLQLAYRQDGSSTWLTWEAPSNLTAMIPLDWGNDDTQIHDIATVPSTQKVIVARERTAGIRLAVIDAEDHSITEQTATLSDGDDWNYPALAVLPGSERIICVYGGASYYSDDSGATWTTLSEQVTTETTTSYGPTSAVVYRGDIVLFVEDNSTPETIHHLVSTDGGATFNLVQSTASLGNQVDAIANDDGIHIVWCDQGTAVEYRRLGTSFEPLDAVTQTVLTTGATWQDVTIWSDGPGALYVLYSGTGVTNEGYISASYDSGETWANSFKARSWDLGDSNDRLGKFRATYAHGQAFLVTGTHNGTSWAADRPMVLVLGGWSDLQFTADGLATQYITERWGFGPHDRSATEQGQTYFPIYAPTNMGWTGTGAGTGAVSDSERALNISTSSNARSYSQDLGTSVDNVVGRARVEVVSGGTTSTQAIAITCRIADASAYEYEAEILLSVSGGAVSVYVNDVNSAATENASLTPTDYVDLYWFMNTGDEAISVFYREPGSMNWTTIDAVSLTDAGATANNSEIAWGHIASATAESNWRELHFATGSGSAKPQLVSAIATRRSRSFNSRPEPIPGMGTTTGAAFLAAVSGPALRGETLDIDAHHDHPVEHIHCERFPGLDTTWRSTSTAEQIFCYDLGSNAWVGHSVGLYVAGANFRTAYLESYNGASWDTEATLDLAEGFTSLRYAISGQAVYPDTGNTTDAGRWLWEQEKRDGVLICTGSTGPTTAATRIVSQSAGGWTQSTTAIPILQLEDVSQIGSLAGTLTAAVCSASGLVVAHQTSVKARRYWRVRIPAGTAGDATPEGESYYEAAIVALCRVQAFGAEVGWGNSDEAEPNQRQREDERGTLYSREMGVEIRTWRLGGWAAGPTHHGEVRATLDVDYVASSLSGALGHAGYHDVFHQLRGLWRVMKGGELPCIAVEPIPDASDTTLTDPSRMLYGRIQGSVRGSRLTGDYDSDAGAAEVLRVSDFTIRELV